MLNFLQMSLLFKDQHLSLYMYAFQKSYFSISILHFILLQHFPLHYTVYTNRKLHRHLIMLQECHLSTENLGSIFVYYMLGFCLLLVFLSGWIFVCKPFPLQTIVFFFSSCHRFQSPVNHINEHGKGVVVHCIMQCTNITVREF